MVCSMWLPARRGLTNFPRQAKATMLDDEFAIIEDLFAPLTEGVDGAFGLKDDAALLGDGPYVVTKDIIVEGVHFRCQDPLDLVAKKLMRVNLSDLAAKGARPVGYLLGCTWRAGTKRKDIATFVEGLSEDQQAFRVGLYGGDTTMHRQENAPTVLSATFFGTPPRHDPIPRDGAKVGDDIYVTGTIGDGFLGLKSFLKEEKFPRADNEYFQRRYQLPEPRVIIGGALAGLASAAIDISDGLMADCAHLIRGREDEISAVLRSEVLPLSNETQDWVEAQSSTDSAMAALATGGDDFEILFTAATSRRRSVEMAANVAKTPVARIGTMVRGDGGVTLLNPGGKTIKIKKSGFNHFR